MKRGFGLIWKALVTGPARRHPLRSLLPVIGVAIGVAAVTAILHANRSVSESFRDAAETVSGRSDFAIAGVRGVPLHALPSLSFLWHVGALAPAVTGFAVVDDPSGEIVEVLGIDPGGDRSVRDVRLVETMDLSDFARLLSERPVLLPVPFAKRHSLSIGKRLALVAGGIRKSVTVGGLLELSGVARASGGDILITDVFTAQWLLGKEGYVDRVDVVLEKGVSREAVREAIAARLPTGLSIEPPGRSAATANEMVRAFRFNLNALGSLTLLVGLFLIANAVSISVLRRRPEIATLRALGSSKAAIFAAFLAEGLTIGAAGTVLGELGGLFLSRSALRAVAGTVSDIYLPTAKISGAPYSATVWLAALVGILAALAATLLPAVEATRVAPSPAMRPGSIEKVRRRSLGFRGKAALAALLLAAVASRAEPLDGFPFFGFAAVALVVAALSLASPFFVHTASSIARRVFARAFGASGRLAAGFFGGALARNAIAVTALAMALGMTLAMIVTVASIRKTVRLWVESTLRSDLWIKAASGKSGGIIGDLPPEIIPFLERIPGVAAVDPFRAREATDDRGRPFTLASGAFAVAARLGLLELLDNRDAAAVAREVREQGRVLVSEPYARRFKIATGDTIAIATPKGVRSFRVGGVYRDFSNDRGTIVFDRQLYLSLFDDPRVTSVAVMAEPGIAAGELRRRVLEGARGRYALSITTNRELRREVLKIFEGTFAMTRALEAIAVAVAVLGIANALMASAVERRRSFGLLRAIGASGRQIRRSVLLEAGLTGAIASLAALVAGGAFAALLLGVINPQSFGWSVALHVPGEKVFSVVALVLAASLAAGIFPGRIAASVDPAAALAEE